MEYLFNPIPKELKKAIYELYQRKKLSGIKIWKIIKIICLLEKKAFISDC